MSVTQSTQDDIRPVAITVAGMSRRLNLSRSRFYSLMEEGVFLRPIYSVDTRRPYYTEAMAQRNIEARRRNVGINGKIVLFYAPRGEASARPTPAKPKRPQPRHTNKDDRSSDLVDDLKTLGMDVTMVQVQSAIAACYPNGITQVNESEVVRQVYRHMKRQNREHNV